MQKHNNNLTLPLKTRWYRLIESGTKKEEYRDISFFWESRLLYARESDCCELTENVSDLIESLWNEHLGFRRFDTVTFTLGYPKKDDASRRMTFRCGGIRIGHGRPEWGAEKDKDYFIVNYPPPKGSGLLRN